MRKLHFLLILLACSCMSFAQDQKVVSILGDSYSTFEGFIPAGNAVWYKASPSRNTDVTSVEQTWWKLWLTENNYTLGMNNSYSGATICDTGYNKEDYSDRSFATRLQNLGQPDVLFIMGGTNDSWAKSPIGEYKYESWTKEDLYQFRPAMAYMLCQIKALYPRTKVYFMLNSELKEEINESVKTICKRYNVPCLELKDIDKQHGHPSIKGMKQICSQLNAFLKGK